jgi:hypothetical protein
VGFQYGRSGSEPTFSQCDSRVDTQEHFTVLVQSFFARDCFEAQMQDGTVTTESSCGRIGSVGRTLTGCHSELGPDVHALQGCSIYTYSRVLGHGQV